MQGNYKSKSISEAFFYELCYDKANERKEKMNSVFSIAKEHLPKTGLTISTPLLTSEQTSVTVFSLGDGTSISPEAYDDSILYIGLYGKGTFLNNEFMECGEALIIPPGTLCGTKTDEGLVYTEIISKEVFEMNEAVKAGEVLKLKDLVPYETGSIVNMDVVSNDAMKFVIMAFDEGTGLTSHRAPGDAVIFALEGKATIGYEGKDYEIKEGENFRFAKNGLHSVTARGKFKMGLLLTLK